MRYILKINQYVLYCTKFIGLFILSYIQYDGSRGNYISHICRISIMEKYVKFYISSILILFLFLGMLYYSIFYRYFGLDVSNYYSFYDYLKGSVNFIYIIFIGLLIGLFYFFLDFKLTDLVNITDKKKVKKSKTTEIKTMHDSLKEMTSLKNIKNEKITLIIIGFAISISILGTYVYLSPLRYFFYSLFYYCIVYLIIHVVLKPRIYMFLVLVLKRSYDFGIVALNIIDLILIVIFLTLGFSLSTADIIKSNPSLYKTKITFSEDIAMNNDNLLLIGSSTEYFFFFDNSQCRSYIIPHKEVRIIERDIKKINFKDIYTILLGKKL